LRGIGLEDCLAPIVSLGGERLETPEIRAQRQAISNIKNSAGFVGRLYPVLVDKHGEIIDGRHRLKADPSWPTVEVKNVDSEERRLIARLVANVCRREVSSTEKTEILRNLGRLYLKQGLHPNQLAKEISQKTGMSYRWVMKYIPDNLKMRPGLGGPKKLKNLYPSIYTSKVAVLATEEYKLLGEPREKVANLASYSNTKFATIILDKRFYLRLKEAASALGVSPDVIINNALLQTLQKVEKLAKENSPPLRSAFKSENSNSSPSMDTIWA
jgi:hypothetical protein